jgi:hypothetical protein
MALERAAKASSKRRERPLTGTRAGRWEGEGDWEGGEEGPGRGEIRGRVRAKVWVWVRMRVVEGGEVGKGSVHAVT